MLPQSPVIEHGKDQYSPLWTDDGQCGSYSNKLDRTIISGSPTIESRIGYGIAIDLSIRGSGLLLIDFPIATRPLTTTLSALIG